MLRRLSALHLIFTARTASTLCRRVRKPVISYRRGALGRTGGFPRLAVLTWLADGDKPKGKRGR